ncbi:MAG TPA: TylF/MycF/NovP-related O-methyltransferase [Gemmatimonadales bacterium]|nr:TylF/MycF/NovP-related O-methyltransferase [Gemmatimonadales bacterium]
MRQILKRLLKSAGWQLNRRVPFDFSPEDVALLERVEPYTMTLPGSVYMCARATEHVIRHGIPGDIVECGVWRGGSMMAIALTLLRLGDQSRDLYLFDTFEGMPSPTAQDVDFAGRAGASKVAAGRQPDGRSWLYVSLEEVRQAVLGTGYDPARVHFVKGKVEDTLPAQAPQQVSMLRLDTDWYESTRHELIHLFPRLSSGGILIIDDYGHWHGARLAVDEYFEKTCEPIFLSRIDYTGRIAVRC